MLPNFAQKRFNTIIAIGAIYAGGNFLISAALEVARETGAPFYSIAHMLPAAECLGPDPLLIRQHVALHVFGAALAIAMATLGICARSVDPHCWLGCCYCMQWEVLRAAAQSLRRIGSRCSQHLGLRIICLFLVQHTLFHHCHTRFDDCLVVQRHR